MCLGFASRSQQRQAQQQLPKKAATLTHAACHMWSECLLLDIVKYSDELSSQSVCGQGRAGQGRAELGKAGLSSPGRALTSLTRQERRGGKKRRGVCKVQTQTQKCMLAWTLGEGMCYRQSFPLQHSDGRRVT